MYLSSSNCKQLYAAFSGLAFCAFSLLPSNNAVAAENPDLLGLCGSDVALVLDESLSISNFSATGHVRTAANAFISAIRDSSSRVQVTEFNGSARTVIPFTEVRSDNENIFHDYINNVTNDPDSGYEPANYSYPNFGTNWEGGIREAISSESTPLLIFVTDGDPTNYLVDPENSIMGGNGFSSDSANVVASYNQAIPAADLAKAAGTHILVVAVGPALTGADQMVRLTGISGPDVVNNTANYNLSQTDVLAIANFADLEAAFRKIAGALCAPSVIFKKLSKDIGESKFTPATDWEFTADVELASGPLGTSIFWKTPNLGSADQTQTAVTDDNGNLAFQWSVVNDLSEPQFEDSLFTWNETLLDYDFVDANCIRKTFNPNGIVESSFSMLLAETITVAANDVVSCAVKNERIAELDVVKDLTHNYDEDGSNDVSIGDTLEYTITATNTGGVTLTNVVVSDGLTGQNTSCASVESGNTCVLVATYVVQASDIGTTIHNVGVADSEETGPEEDPEDVLVPTPALNVVKSLTNNADEDSSGTVSLNDTLTYVITATNIGSANLTNVTINDSLTGDTTTCPGVAPTKTCVLTVIYTVSQADVAAGIIHNVGIADSDQTPPTEDPEDVEVALPIMDLCEDDKPMGVYFRYDGTGAQDDTHTQTSNEVIVDGNPLGANPVFIEVYDHHKGSRATTLFAGIVNLNGAFYVTGTKRRIPPRLRFHLYREEGGELLQIVQFHTSCSQPLSAGDSFGSIVVLGEAEGGGKSTGGAVPGKDKPAKSKGKQAKGKGKSGKDKSTRGKKG